MWWAFDRIAERRIADAMAQGVFDDLPGKGKPVCLDDDALIPAELRLAYRVLKNSGYVTDEVRTRREIGEIEGALKDMPQGAPRVGAVRRLSLLRTRLEANDSRRGRQPSGL